MLFEDLDKKIKEAAEQHHPAYDENAWQKMDKLLSHHLPQQKDDRRRIIFFILLALLIGGGTYFTIAKPWNKKSGTEQVAQDKKISAPVTSGNEASTEKTIPTKQEPDKTKQVATKSNNNDVLINRPTIPAANSFSTSVSKKPLKKIDGNDPGIQTTPDREISLNNNGIQNKNNGLQKNNIASDDLSKQPGQKIVATETNKTNPDLAKIADNNNANKIANDIVATETKTNVNQPTQAAAVKQAKPSKKSFKNNNGISFLISAGPDVSKAGSSKTGKTTLSYGAGIGYTKNRITLRAGVYTAKKIYWAGSNDYKLSFVPVPPSKFIGADANCAVIEIPVKLSYSFVNKKLSNWFAGAGLSTYLMKRETYIYNYKNYLGTTSFVYETKNESKHYFSVLNLSAGYTRKINNAISITAEPYAEIPLTGIGIGKVHLNSGGVLFTVGFHPFKK